MSLKKIEIMDMLASTFGDNYDVRLSLADSINDEIFRKQRRKQRLDREEATARAYAAEVIKAFQACEQEHTQPVILSSKPVAIKTQKEEVRVKHRPHMSVRLFTNIQDPKLRRKRSFLHSKKQSLLYIDVGHDKSITVATPAKTLGVIPAGDDAIGNTITLVYENAKCWSNATDQSRMHYVEKSTPSRRRFPRGRVIAAIFGRG